MYNRGAFIGEEKRKRALDQLGLTLHEREREAILAANFLPYALTVMRGRRGCAQAKPASAYKAYLGVRKALSKRNVELDALAFVRSPHFVRGLATARGDFHDLWPRTMARTLTTMGFLRHWGDVVFVNTIHPNRAQRTVNLSSSSPQVWLCSVGVN